jgi:hypothetical protein
MNAGMKQRTLEDFRAANCKAASCTECETNRVCLPYTFFAACQECNRTDIEVAVKVLEDKGFHVSEAREERATRTETGYVIDDHGTVDTGAILLRVVPRREADQQP